jgi:hypothetical protein
MCVYLTVAPFSFVNFGLQGNVGVWVLFVGIIPISFAKLVLWGLEMTTPKILPKGIVSVVNAAIRDWVKAIILGNVLKASALVKVSGWLLPRQGPAIDVVGCKPLLLHLDNLRGL